MDLCEGSCLCICGGEYCIMLSDSSVPKHQASPYVLIDICLTALIVSFFQLMQQMVINCSKSSQMCFNLVSIELHTKNRTTGLTIA